MYFDNLIKLILTRLILTINKKIKRDFNELGLGKNHNLVAEFKIESESQHLLNFSFTVNNIYIVNFNPSKFDLFII